MKEILENKIKDIITYIVNKEPENVTYNEYRILDGKLKEIKYTEEQKERNKAMMNAMSECFVGGFGSATKDLPESSE